MASTIKSTARGWHEVSSAAHWTARVLWDTGTALYAVVQDTGATPKVRVMKADSRTAPTTWTEQDSANNKTITNVAFPFSSWLAGTTLHVVVFTATNTITHYQFNTSTDLWGTGKGAVTTAAENEHSIRVVARSDGDTLVFFTSSADDADLGYLAHNGTAWGDDSADGATAILAANTTDASSIIDAGIDSTDRAWVVFYDSAASDITYLTINSGGTIATAVDIETTGAAPLSQQSGARFNLYDDAGTDKIIAAYINSAPAIDERIVTLESDAASGNLATEAAVEATTTDVGARTPISTAVFAGVPYCVYWDDATSGTIKYTTKSGGSWAAETNWKTAVSRIIEIVPLETGLAAVYQSDATTVAFEWIKQAVTAPTAAATGAAVAPTIKAIVTPPTATVTASAYPIEPATRRALVSWAEVEIPAAPPATTVSAPTATVTSAAVAPTIQALVPAPTAAATSAAVAPTIIARVLPPTATVTAAANVPTILGTAAFVVAPTATVTSAANAPTVIASVPVPTATATAAANVPTVLAEVVVPTATVTSAANAPTILGTAAFVAAPTATASAAAIAPTVRAIVPAVTATATATANAPTVLASVPVPTATATSTAAAPTIRAIVVVPTATVTAMAQEPFVSAGDTSTRVFAPTATATAAANAPTLAVRVQVPTAAVSASANAPTIRALVVVPTAAATAAANVPTITASVPAPTATVTSAASAPTLRMLVVIPTATATATAVAPNVAVGTADPVFTLGWNRAALIEAEFREADLVGAAFGAPAIPRGSWEE